MVYFYIIVQILRKDSHFFKTQHDKSLCKKHYTFWHIILDLKNCLLYIREQSFSYRSITFSILPLYFEPLRIQIKYPHRYSLCFVQRYLSIYFSSTFLIVNFYPFNFTCNFLLLCTRYNS